MTIAKRFNYFVDGKQVTQDMFELLVDEAVENIAKEDGIFYEWLYSGLPTNEYEDFIESLTHSFWEKIEQNEEATVIMFYKFETRLNDFSQVCL